jgi:hypothetical protein
MIAVGGVALLGMMHRKKTRYLIGILSQIHIVEVDATSGVSGILAKAAIL